MNAGLLPGVAGNNEEHDVGPVLPREVHWQGRENRGKSVHVCATHHDVDVFGRAGGTAVHAVEPRGDGVAADDGVPAPGRVEGGGGASKSLLDAVVRREV